MFDLLDTRTLIRIVSGRRYLIVDDQNIPICIVLGNETWADFSEILFKIIPATFLKTGAGFRGTTPFSVVVPGFFKSSSLNPDQFSLVPAAVEDCSDASEIVVYFPLFLYFIFNRVPSL
jgi:hypothetical protein